MVPAVRPLGSLSMARGCARIDSRPDIAKIGSADRVEVHHARLLAVIGVRKTFPHGLGQIRKLATQSRLPRYPCKQTSRGHRGRSGRCHQETFVRVWEDSCIDAVGPSRFERRHRCVWAQERAVILRWCDLIHIGRSRYELLMAISPILGVSLEIANGCYRKSSFARVWNSG